MWRDDGLVKHEMTVQAGATDQLLNPAALRQAAGEGDGGGEPRFSSAILPPWVRKTPEITEVLPPRYLHGRSGGAFVPAMGQFLGSSAGVADVVHRRQADRGPVGVERLAE